MKKIIAVVDDDQPIVDVVSFILKEEGYEVIGCNDGKRLLSTVEKERISLIILDYMLPNQNGVEIAKKLKGKTSTKNIPVIMISAIKSTPTSNSFKK